MHTAFSRTEISLYHYRFAIFGKSSIMKMAAAYDPTEGIFSKELNIL